MGGEGVSNETTPAKAPEATPGRKKKTGAKIGAAGSLGNIQHPTANTEHRTWSVEPETLNLESHPGTLKPPRGEGGSQGAGFREGNLDGFQFRCWQSAEPLFKSDRRQRTDGPPAKSRHGAESFAVNVMKLLGACTAKSQPPRQSYARASSDTRDPSRRPPAAAAGKGCRVAGVDVCSR